MAQKKLSVIVADVISQVRKRGNAALIQFAKKFDGVSLSSQSIRVDTSELKEAFHRLSVEKRRALTVCAGRIKYFHQLELKRLPKSWSVNHKGVRLGQIYSAIESVGIYVPGGRFSYPSTLLMTAIPAKLAGVKRRAVVTPPKMLTDEIKAAAYIAGIEEFYQVGGPAALAALSIGTQTIKKVDLIIGPGNALVTEAKRQLYGEVGIDLLAGPSELVVIADNSANPTFVAADLAAQAEHDPDAVGFLISTSKLLISEVRKILPLNLERQCRFILKTSLNEAALEADRIAGEHVQIVLKDSLGFLKKVKNGGAFFIGSFSPAVMGDYWAGPSHVLPTGRSARFCSGLSVSTFMKRSSLIDISSSAFKAGWKSAYAVAKSEGLIHHAASLSKRIKN